MKLLLFITVLLASSVGASITLDFEDFNDLTFLSEEYNQPPYNYGISFVSDSSAITASIKDGVYQTYYGAEINRQTGSKVIFLPNASSKPLTINLPYGFSSFKFSYSFNDANPAWNFQIIIYSDVNLGGDVLQTYQVPVPIGADGPCNGKLFCVWVDHTLSGFVKFGKSIAILLDYPRDGSNLLFPILDDLVFGLDCLQGETIKIANVDRCSCYSGWSGVKCDVPTTSFAPSPVNPASLAFDIVALLNANPVSPKRAASDPIITISIPASESAANHPGGPSYSTTTLLQFNGGNQNCDYPNSPWDISSTSSTDTYVKQVSWSQLHDCGLVKTGVVGGFTYFNTSINVIRNFFVGNGRFGFTRQANVQRNLAVAFPSEVTALKSFVIVSNNTVDAFGSISQVNWITSNQAWKMVLTTVVAAPYKLNFDTTFNAHPFTIGDPNRKIIYSANQPEVACTFNAQQDCTQSFHFETNACDSISFSGWKLTFHPKCRSGNTPNDEGAGECASPNKDPIDFTLSLTTTTACPIDSTYIIGMPVLTSYKEGSNPGTVGTISGLFGSSETIYFQVSFDSPPAKIDTITVSALCAYPSTATPSGNCNPTNSVDEDTDVSSAAVTATPPNNQVAFSVNAGTLKSKAGTLPSNQPNKIIVQVDLNINYLDNFGSKRNVPVSHMFYGSTQLSFSESTEANEYVSSSSSHKIYFTLLILGAFVLSF